MSLSNKKKYGGDFCANQSMNCEETDGREHKCVVMVRLGLTDLGNDGAP